MYTYRFCLYFFWSGRDNFMSMYLMNLQQLFGIFMLFRGLVRSSKPNIIRSYQQIEFKSSESVCLTLIHQNELLGTAFENLVPQLKPTESLNWLKLTTFIKLVTINQLKCGAMLNTVNIQSVF